MATILPFVKTAEADGAMTEHLQPSVSEPSVAAPDSDHWGELMLKAQDGDKAA